MRRFVCLPTFIAATIVIGASAAVAQGTGRGPATDPTENGGNTLINSGKGSGTGTDAPGPGMTLKEGANPRPTAAPTENGGNTIVNGGSGSGTGTAEPATSR